jgi:carbon monoxide dehydrogenase subunit G
MTLDDTNIPRTHGVLKQDREDGGRASRSVHSIRTVRRSFQRVYVIWNRSVYRTDSVMSNIQVFIDIDRPLIDVWDQVSRLEDHAHWMGDVDSITFDEGQVSGVGTTMNVLTRVGPFTTTDVIVVEEWNPPHSIVVSHQGLISGRGAFHLEPLGAQTRFTWRESLSFPWYLGGGITAAVARPILARIWRANLRRFSATFN